MYGGRETNEVVIPQIAGTENCQNISILRDGYIVTSYPVRSDSANVIL